MTFPMEHVKRLPLGALRSPFCAVDEIKTGYGLFLAPTFIVSVLKEAEVEQPVTEAHLDIFKLGICYPRIGEVRERVAHSESGVEWWQINRLRQKQPYGEPGELNLAKIGNFFLMPDRAIRLYRWAGDTIPDGPEWHLTEAGSDDDRLGPHALVFVVPKGPYDDTLI